MTKENNLHVGIDDLIVVNEEADNLPLDEYIRQPVSRKLHTIYSDEESPLFDEKYAPKSPIADEMERISVECSKRHLHPLVLAAIEKGRCGR